MFVKKCVEVQEFRTAVDHYSSTKNRAGRDTAGAAGPRDRHFALDVCEEVCRVGDLESVVVCVIGL